MPGRNGLVKLVSFKRLPDHAVRGPAIVATEVLLTVDFHASHRRVFVIAAKTKPSHAGRSTLKRQNILVVKRPKT